MNNIPNRKIIIITAGVLLVGIIILVIVSVSMKQDVQKRDMGTQYVDPGSGEVIIENPNRSPQSTFLDGKTPTVFLGFSKLLDNGLSSSQTQSIQSAFSSYAEKENTHFDEVSMTVSTLRYASEDGGVAKKMTFDTKINRTDDYFVTVEFSDLVTCVTKIYKSDKTTLLFTQ